MNTDLSMDSPGERRAPAGRRIGPAGTTVGFEISVHRGMEPLETEWRMLDGFETNSLHHAYEWCRAWVETHGSDLLLLRITLDGALFLILPLELERGRLFRTARLIGTEHSNLNTGLFARGAAAATTPALARALVRDIQASLRGLADVVILDKLPHEWRGHAHPFAPLPGIANPNASFQLPLLGDIQQTLAQINAKRRRKKMRISERRLAETGGYDYVIAGTADEARALLDTFFRQKAARFATLGLPDVFQEPQTQAFFRALADRQDGDPLLMQLNAIVLKGDHGGQVAAIAGLSRKGGHVICQFGSIDEALAADASPGELLFYRMIERLSSQGARLFDFGVGDQLYKRSWCTIETALRDVVLPLTLTGRIAALRHRLLVRAKTMAKADKTLYARIQRARRRMQGKPMGDTRSDPD